MSVAQKKTSLQILCLSILTVIFLGLCPFTVSAEENEVDRTLLEQPGPLGDIVQGSEKAPVTVVEYFSFTCYHCANFHETVYPQIKADYIDTGKVRYITRDFPLDAVAMTAAIIARCEGNEKYPAFVNLLLKNQKDWAFSSHPLDALKEQVKQAGVTSEKFDSCLKTESLYRGVVESRKRAADRLGVNATPAFFINGERMAQGMNFQNFQDKINALLSKEGANPNP
jgi:protein-disulfide isomerase